MLHDLRIEVRCRNNVLWHAIHDLFPSVAEFCRRHALNQQIVGGFLNLTLNPYGKPGDLRPSARRLCTVTGLGQDELFPVVLYDGVIPSRRVAQISAVQFPRPIQAGVRVALPPAGDREIFDHERIAIVDTVLSTALTPRQEYVIRNRFGIGAEETALEDIGKALNVGPERVRQIELKALQRLRNKRNAKRLRVVGEGSDDGQEDEQP